MVGAISLLRQSLYSNIHYFYVYSRVGEDTHLITTNPKEKEMSNYYDDILGNDFPGQKWPEEEGRESKDKKFWILWNPDSHSPPVRKYTSFQDAVASATKCAELSGQSFYVLEAKAVLAPSLVLQRDLE